MCDIAGIVMSADLISGFHLKVAIYKNAIIIIIMPSRPIFS